MPATATYAEAIAHLNALVPELHSIPGQPRRKFSLAEIGLLSAALGSPHQKFPSILIAGTNGKGSTASTLASIAQAAGLKVGLYTSPHLERPNERIKIDKQDIPDSDFGQYYFRVIHAAEKLVAENTLAHLPPGSPRTGPGSWGGPSFFELLTALAFLYFAEQKVDLAILEVGMGGRLDATNLVDPLISVLTDISLDHQQWLGDTIAAITREKAGILRPNGTLVTLPQHPEANQAIGEAAVELNVRGIPATDYIPTIRTSPTAPYQLEVLGQTITVDSPLKGHHQHRNIALAIATAVELAQHHNFPITPAAIEQGIRTTQWPARFEILRQPGHPEFILDVAHNPAGAWALRSALSNSAPPGAPGLASPGSPATGLRRWGGETWDQSQSTTQVLVFACLRDKPLREMTQILFPLFDHVILAPIHSPRATDLADLLAAAEATGVHATPSGSVQEAIDKALALQPARIVISGSVYLVGEARTILLNHELTAQA